MIKKISTLFLLLLSLATTSFADKEVKVKLDNNNDNGKVEYNELLNIFVELREDKDGGVVTIKLENKDNTKGFYLFDKRYDETALKKMRPKVKFDKNFSGNNSGKIVTSCKNLEEVIRLKKGEDKEEIMTQSVDSNEYSVINVELPVYIYEEKTSKFLFWKWTKDVLKHKEVITLIIDVDLTIDNDREYSALKEECDKLIEEYNSITFCKHPNHKPSLKEQKDAFKAIIDGLLIEIVAKRDKLWSINSWKEGHYKDLIESIEKLKEDSALSKKEIKNCGKHSVKSRHLCSFCDYSLEQINSELSEIYLSIYNSDDRDAKKAECIKDVEAMYKCAKRRSDWNDSEYREGITDYYDSIINDKF